MSMLLRTFLKSVIAAVFWTLAILPTYADLISMGSRFGPDTLVRDTNTSLDWLILPITQGLSVGEVMEAVEPGGSLAEFRLAVRDELVDLLESQGLPITTSCFGSCFLSGQNFVNLFRGNAGLVGPITVVEPNIVELFGFQLSLFPSLLEVAGDLQLLTRVLDDAKIGDHFFLVAETTAIPEPGSLAFLVSGFVGFVFLACRRRPFCRGEKIWPHASSECEGSGSAGAFGAIDGTA